MKIYDCTWTVKLFLQMQMKLAAVVHDKRKGNQLVVAKKFSCGN